MSQFGHQIKTEANDDKKILLFTFTCQWEILPWFLSHGLWVNVTFLDYKIFIDINCKQKNVFIDKRRIDKYYVN